MQVGHSLLVSVASSRAISSPMIVTARAANLSKGGMDITGVLRGVMLEVIRRPATILPHASRFKGLMTAGLFSLMGEMASLRKTHPLLKIANSALVDLPAPSNISV